MPEDEQAEAAFRDDQDQWLLALEGQWRAPPDAVQRPPLGALADAARVEALACRAAHDVRFEWPPHRLRRQAAVGASAGVGPTRSEELSRRFDAAVAELNRAATGSDLVAVAGAYNELAASAEDCGRGRGSSVGAAAAATGSA